MVKLNQAKKEISMIKKLSLTFFLFIFITGSTAVFSQRAVTHKPVSSNKEKIVHHYNYPGIGKAEIPTKYYSELSSDRKKIRIFEEKSVTDYSKKKFINYTSYSNNYFKVDENNNSLWDGKHWDFTDFPLKVYVMRSSSKHFKNKHKSYVDYALKIWETADERISFSYTNSSADADIIFSFEDNLMEKYDENYLGLTDYEVGRDKGIIRSFVEISLLKFNNRKISDGEIKSTIIHELGHALGLGHSSNHFDLMYPYINENSSEKLSYIELSTGDIEAIRSVVDLGGDNISIR